MIFPANPPRGLGLTSPLSQDNKHVGDGHDVSDLQRACNIWATAHGLPLIAVDGQYGPATDHQVQLVAYSMGLRYLRAMRPTIRLIYHPWTRSPADLARARQRVVRRPQGLAALPSIAAQYIGVQENPPGSNVGYPEPSGWEQEFGMNGVSWCGCFAGAMVLKAGGHVTSRVAYCPYIESDARNSTNGFERWEDNHQNAAPGWLVLYCWDGSGVPEHVGIVEAIGPSQVSAIEGNTGGTNPADGGMVAREQRDYSVCVGYAKPRL